MKYQISIKSLNEIGDDGHMYPGPYLPFMVEAELGGFSESGFPSVFNGKLIDVPLEKILEFKFSPGVDVVFRGSGYIFEELEKDGTFKLCRG